jgi:hypothetical protein
MDMIFEIESSMIQWVDGESERDRGSVSRIGVLVVEVED